MKCDILRLEMGILVPSLSTATPPSSFKKRLRKNMQSISSSPAHLLLSPSDNSRLISGSSFNNVGLSSIKDSSAFKKIQYYSKTNNQPCASSISHFNNRYNRINSLYLNTSKFNADWVVQLSTQTYINPIPDSIKREIAFNTSLQKDASGRRIP